MSNNSDTIAGIDNVAVNPRKSLKQTKPSIILQPFEQTTTESYDLDQVTADTIKNKYETEVHTTYKGRKALDIQYDFASGLQLKPATEYPYPLNEWEDGELYHFSVATNSKDVRIVCIIYGEATKANALINETPEELTYLGRGMTHSVATVVDHNEYSTDPEGDSHRVMPYVRRFKHTFSYPFKDTDYADIAGTKDDRWFVVEYEPVNPKPYNKIYFTLQNLGSANATIHKGLIQRYKFVDTYDTEVIKKDEILNRPAAIGI